MTKVRLEHIRNFSIIAHIDHGKSTLADRLIEITGAISDRDMKDQVLDTMDLERERGITIKAQAIRLTYNANDGKTYMLNLIDTPGHVDFTYEVSRSLAACEGALLVIDASQGVEAQTLANLYLAMGNNLEIIPIINKIDLPGANIDDVKNQIENILGFDTKNVLLTSAKLGTGVKEVLEAIVKLIPPPVGYPVGPLRALIFDSSFDNFRGVITYVKIVDGEIKAGDKIKFMSIDKEYEVDEVGYFSPEMTPIEKLYTGEVGYIIAGIKDISSVKIGDTVTMLKNPAHRPLPGYKDIQPVVFCGFFPVNSDDYDDLKDSIYKLRLNDCSFTVEPETSAALGFGFRCGFLGLLHMDIIQERLEREYGVEILATAPNTVYQIVKTNGETIIIDNPSKLPGGSQVDKILEPIIEGTIIIPSQYVGNVLKLCQSKRGIQKQLKYISETKVIIVYELPLPEILLDFYDRLKTISQGYASFDYEFIGYHESNLCKLDILVNGEIIDALSIITHKENAYHRGQELADKLRKIIPRQLFEVAIQAAIGNRVIARESVKALRKNVTAKCYGGDITRKRKLLEKQREGKKRMKKVGKIEIPQEAFLSVLKVEDTK